MGRRVTPLSPKVQVLFRKVICFRFFRVTNVAIILIERVLTHFGMSDTLRCLRKLCMILERRMEP